MRELRLQQRVYWPAFTDLGYRSYSCALAEVQRHILHSRTMIVDTQHSILMLDGMLRELSTTRQSEMNRFSRPSPENILCRLITPADL